VSVRCADALQEDAIHVNKCVEFSVFTDLATFDCSEQRKARAKEA
jgi:hypothetical protein